MTTERTMKKYYGPSGYVNTKGVEDGMGDELVCSDKELEDCWDHLAVPVEERTANERPMTLEEWRDETSKLEELVNKLMDENERLRKPIPEERTAEMEQLMGAVETMISWCPRGWSLELDQAMTATRKALAHIEGKAKAESREVKE